MLTPLAQVDPEAILGMLIGFGLVVVLPMVGMMLAHQRKMAEMLHKQRSEMNTAADDRVHVLSAEVRELRTLVHDLIIRQDGTPGIQARLSQPPPLPPEELRH